MEKMKSLLKEQWNLRIFFKNKNYSDAKLNKIANDILDLLVKKGFEPTKIITSNQDE